MMTRYRRGGGYEGRSEANPKRSSTKDKKLFKGVCCQREGAVRKFWC